jgi:hypothetical protein
MESHLPASYAEKSGAVSGEKVSMTSFEQALQSCVAGAAPLLLFLLPLVMA